MPPQPQIFFFGFLAPQPTNFRIRLLTKYTIQFEFDDVEENPAYSFTNEAVACGLFAHRRQQSSAASSLASSLFPVTSASSSVTTLTGRTPRASFSEDVPCGAPCGAACGAAPAVNFSDDYILNGMDSALDGGRAAHYFPRNYSASPKAGSFTFSGRGGSLPATPYQRYSSGSAAYKRHSSALSLPDGSAAAFAALQSRNRHPSLTSIQQFQSGQGVEVGPSRRRLFSFPQARSEEARAVNAQDGAHSAAETPEGVPAGALEDDFLAALTPKFEQMSITGQKNKEKQPKIAEMNVLELARDQCGCRYLQRKLDEGTADSFAQIFGPVCAHAAELMMDPFGNYLMQKVMGCCTVEQLDAVLISAGPALCAVAVDQHGTRALQKLIERISTRKQRMLLERYLAPYVVALIGDLNGNHVIQKCVQRFRDSDLQFIVDQISANIVPVSTHKHGCCVLQKLLNKCNMQQIEQLGAQIVQHSLALMEDQYANYVVQYLASMEIDSLNAQLLATVAPCVRQLSCQKFSSNVVEKCLRIRSYRVFSQFVSRLLDEILLPDVLPVLIRDQYGNYVVQTAMEVSSAEYKLRFARELAPLLPEIRFASFGKRIHNKVGAILQQANRLK